MHLFSAAIRCLALLSTSFSYEVNGLSQGLAYSEVPAPLYPAISMCGSGVSLIDELEGMPVLVSFN